MTAPTLAASAAGIGSGPGAVTIPNHSAGDLLVVIFGDNGGDKTISSTGQTWTQVLLAPLSFPEVIVTVWTTVATATRTGYTASIADPGAAGAWVYTSHRITNGAFHLGAYNSSGGVSQTTAVSVSGVTTTVNDCLVLQTAFLSDPEEDDTPTLTAGSWANANLSGFAQVAHAERDVSTGTDDSVSTAAGTLASAGATGTGTATATKSCHWTGVTLAFEPHSTSRGLVVGFMTLN